MKRLLLPLFMIITIAGFAQPGDSIKKSHGRRLLISNDSVAAKLEKLKDSVIHSPGFDSIGVKENIDQNVSGILQMQKDRNAREKKAAIIRIGIGLAFLVILIIGLRRRRVKK